VSEMAQVELKVDECKPLVLGIIRQQPWWNRTEGRDHIFVFPGARGPTIFNEWQSQIGRSVYLTPEAGPRRHCPPPRHPTYFQPCLFE